MGISTVTMKGTNTIPEEIRMYLSIHAGDKILYHSPNKKNNEVVIKVVHTENVVDRLYGSFYRSGMKYVPIEVARKKAGKLLAEKYGLKK